MEKRREIGQRIRQVREKLKLSQIEFGKLIGASGTTISSYEIGDAYPSIDALIRIINKGGVTYNWLITGSEAKEGSWMKQVVLSQDEERLLELFRRSSREDKRVILRVAENAALIRENK